MHCLWITLGVVGVRDIAVSYIQTDQGAVDRDMCAGKWRGKACFLEMEPQELSFL